MTAMRDTVFNMGQVSFRSFPVLKAWLLLKGNITHQWFCFTASQLGQHCPQEHMTSLLCLMAEVINYLQVAETWRPMSGSLSLFLLFDSPVTCLPTNTSLTSSWIVVVDQPSSLPTTEHMNVCRLQGFSVSNSPRGG